MKKTTIISALSDLPKEINLDDFLERLIVIDKIEAGLKDAKEGKTLSHEAVKKRMKKWLK
jgi:predicted transcriptional regulator